MALVAMMIHINIDVAGRGLLNKPAPATLDSVSYYYMLAVVFFPMPALAYSKGGLVCVDLFYSIMPAVLQRITLFLASFLTAVYCAMAAYAAWGPAMNAYNIGSYVGTLYPLIIWPTRFFPILGFGILSVVLALNSVQMLLSGSLARESEKSISSNE
jgi:TRAP-type mannitol/chloroaromatic compound transport system permease small subunit